MDFATWLRAKGFDPDTLTPEQKQFFQAVWRAEQNPPAPAPVPAPPPNPAPAPAPVPNPVPNPGPISSFDEQLRVIEAENARQVYIQTATMRAMEANVGNTEKIRQLREVCAAALSDKKVTRQDFDLSLLRLDRFGGITIHSHNEPALTGQVLEAAICQTQRLKDVEKRFDDRTLQTAHDNFPRGVGLQELLMIAARQNNGYRGSARDTAALCQAAFRTGWHGQQGPMSVVGPSGISVPGILSNVANKFLAAGFLFGEQSWRQVTRIKPATDFKQMTTYRLTGANKFAKIAPGGEITHGTLGELSYTNQVDTYGRMLGIDRRDIRNDDLGAFTGASDELGRGAIDSLNEVFWTEWLADGSTFYTTAQGNYDDGATDTLIDATGINNAETLFRLQTKPDGTPLGAMPAIILTPASLVNNALTLMGSQQLVGGSSTVPSTNIFQGRYRVVSSVYLQSSAISGSSNKAWYLLADPNNIAVIEVAFLDGMETPIVETSEFDFDRLGIAMRGYMDWGCNKQEYRGGVKMKGEN